MGNIAYLDCPTGIAGDMCLGALVHAGVPLTYLQDIVHKLGLDLEVKLWTELVIRGGIEATKLHVELLNYVGNEPTTVAADNSHGHSHDHAHSHAHDHDAHAHGEHSHRHDHHETHTHQGHRHLPDIEKIIRHAKLPVQVEKWSLAIFKELAIAEGAVHGIAPESVHFHEVGAIDAIVDIVCTCAGFAWLEVEKIYCSALPAGGGYVNCDHGKMPVPAPATLKLWELHGVTTFDNGIRKELVTPTGAAIAVTLSEKFGEVPLMKIKKVGLGAGSQDLEIPNALRLWVGKSKSKDKKRLETHTALSQEVDKSHPIATITEIIVILETQVDDMSAQAIAYTMEQLLQNGALDVYTQAVGMKKSRNGTLITVICHCDRQSICEQILFQETSTLGIRYRCQERKILHREIHEVATEYGMARVKMAWRDGFWTIQPEYEDCAKLARSHHVPLTRVQETVKLAGEVLANSGLLGT